MVDDLPFTPPAVNPTPSDFVWSLEKDVKWVVCELHDHGATGENVESSKSPRQALEFLSRIARGMT